MAHTIKRTVAGGALAVAITAGAALTGAGAANAIPQAPSGDGAYVGQSGFVQSGSDPNIHMFTWNGGSWDYNGCYGGIYYDVR